MKRRSFLTAAGTVGIVGVASSATVVNSVYNNISTSVLLEEFDAPSKKVLNKFVTDITENAESLGLNTEFAKKMAMPVQIVSQNSTKGNSNIVYKNRKGQSISISVADGKGKIKVLSVG